MDTSADKAAALLIHYFELVARNSGIPWDDDNRTEIRVIVDHLMNAARDIAREEVEAHDESEPHLYADGSRS